MERINGRWYFTPTHAPRTVYPYTPQYFGPEFYVYKDKYLIVLDDYCFDWNNEKNLWEGHLECMSIYDENLNEIPDSDITVDFQADKINQEIDFGPSYKIYLNPLYENYFYIDGDKIIYKSNKDDTHFVTSEITEKNGKFTSTIIKEETDGYEPYRKY